METKTAKRKVFLICVLLLAATIIFYGGIYRNKFVNYDDNVYVTENQQIQTGLSGFFWMLTMVAYVRYTSR